MKSNIKNEEKNIMSFDIHQKIIGLKKDIESKFIKMGAMLKLVRDQKLYKEKGAETFEEYIAQPELAFNRSTVYAVINVFETFFDRKSNQSDEELIEIGYSKLNRISQFKDQENFEEWIYKAKTLSLSDLGAEINEAKGTKATPVVEQESRKITCPRCGSEFEIII